MIKNKPDLTDWNNTKTNEDDFSQTEKSNRKYKHIAKSSFVFFPDGKIGHGFESGQEISEEYIKDIEEYLYEKVEIKSKIILEDK